MFTVERSVILIIPLKNYKDVILYLGNWRVALNKTRKNTKLVYQCM